jgi:hypothetical protein
LSDFPPRVTRSVSGRRRMAPSIAAPHSPSHRLAPVAGGSGAGGAVKAPCSNGWVQQTPSSKEQWHQQ